MLKSWPKYWLSNNLHDKRIACFWFIFSTFSGRQDRFEIDRKFLTGLCKLAKCRAK